ncbi:PH domain-containing protein [Candidatus Uhrbacteria bacterium]|nr:PH domain-containing protein [Candidatus Uhrbacteria bacterium]
MDFSKILKKLLPVPKEYEKLAVIVKRHWVTFIPYAALFLLLAALPAGGYFFAKTYEPQLLATVWLPLIFVLGGSAWYLFALLLFFTHFTDFFLDVWIVTNERVIAIVQKGLFHREVSQARLYQVQDVRAIVKGPIQMIFGLGDLRVETAGLGHGEFHFDNIPAPNEVARRIMELVEGDRKYHEEKIRLLKIEETPRIIDSGA